jgi:hypothetical protein
LRVLTQALSALALLLIADPIAQSQCVDRNKQKLVASDILLGDEFGAVSSMHGDELILGAPDANGSFGAAYVFRFLGVIWQEEQELTASGVGGAAAGRAADIENGLAAVSSVNFVSSDGEVDLFRFDGNSWVVEQKLTSPDPLVDDFGHQVALAGSQVLVSALGDPSSGNSPSAVFVFNNTGTTWVHTSTLVPDDPFTNPYYGSSLEVHADVAIVGSPEDHLGCPPTDPTCASGAVYVYRRVGTTWAEEQRLTASDADPGQRFGHSVSTSGNLTLVGANFDDSDCPNDPDCNSGAAYVFRHNGTQWIEEAKLTASGSQPDDEFGASVAIDEEVVLVNAIRTGEAYIFRIRGTEWVQVRSLITGDNAFNLSNGDVDQDRALVGAPNHLSMGAAYVYDLPGFSLSIVPKNAQQGNNVSFKTCSGIPGTVGAMFIVAIDQNPIFFRLPILGVFDDFGVWRLSGTLNVSPGMVDIDFRAFSIDNDGFLMQSNDAGVSFQ